MRIAIDCRFAATKSGLGRYTRELVRALVPLPGVDWVLFVRSQDEEWIPPNVEVHVLDIPHYSVAEQIRLPRIIQSVKADLLFSPHFTVPLRCPVPFVVTIHDLILHRYPNKASLVKILAYRFQMKHAVSHARSIITVSEFVKRELLLQYGESIASKTSVITEGVSEMYVPADKEAIDAVRSRYHLTKPYLLYVGNAKQHKNLSTLLAAFTMADLPGIELLLLTAGSEIDRLGELPPTVRRVENLRDDELPALYSGALACVTASLYEGYCLPIAEALACGCPVIASNASAIPETAAGHAVLLDPTPAAFAEAFQHIPDHQEAIRVGSWEQAANDTLHILLT